jgi:hypothetical protein
VYGYFKIPRGVLWIREGILAAARNEYEISEVHRLFHHPRMEAVWKQLTAEKQGMPGVYLHPAVGGAVSPGGPAYAQQLACAKVFSFLFYAVCNPVPVSKWDETKEYREKILAGPAESRRVADKLAANGLVDPEANGAAAAALRLALVEEERARQILAQTRTRDDPLVIVKDRGDRTARGLATVIAARLHELFGEHLYGIAAILAEVGLGEKVGRRMVRTACGPRKSSAKKSNT